MAWTKYQVILAVTMVITGSLNTLSTKLADNAKAMGTERVHAFNHPFFQAVGMFIGEFSCLGMYLISIWYNRRYNPDYEEATKFNPIIFLPAAMMDICGTSMLYIGLNLTFASSFQMLRGAVIIFTAFLSVAFLHRTLRKSMWAGIVGIIAGLALVGSADIIFSSAAQHKDRNGIIAGDLLIVAAQVVVATQMVYEEKFVNKHNVPPLKAVGLEGLFGMVILSLLLIPFYYINGGEFFHTNPENRVEDPIDAFRQMGNNYVIIIATVGNIVSIAFFNFSGISVTKEINATTRMVLDSLRTLVIWVVSLIVSWQKFQYLQLIGYFLLLVGMCLYNNIIIVPFINKFILRRDSSRDLWVPPSLEHEVTQPLLGDKDVDQHVQGY